MTSNDPLTLITAVVVPKSEGSLTLSLLRRAEHSLIPKIEDTISSPMNGILKLDNNLSETLTPFLILQPGLHLPVPSSNLSVIGLLLGDGTDADKGAYIRKNLFTVSHPVRTAKMSSESGAIGVTYTYSRLKVKVIHKC
ncbi:hypothetical protein K435DRAFT_859558 [Dendrothele bispora CBS 962.96]|uniref:Uncharacterized protein n=1 Tax=Dendrothele bispora (strain CBS 962.96) TaxID=1314807 RepID=A0A4S8M0U7_DENBC|nr:hypothetical protein K435DRAFT_859558 [Dendrothele bispora CBS 962.96]